MNGNGNGNADAELRKVAIIVLGAVLITSIVSLTITVALSGRGSESGVQWVTLGTVALAVVAAGPIVVLRPREHLPRRRVEDIADQERDRST